MSARTTTNPAYHGVDVGPFKGIAITPHVGAPPSKPRHVVIASNMSSRVDFGAHNNDLPNLIRALNERVFNVEDKSPGGKKKLVPTPQPEKGAWRSLAQVATRIARRVSTIPLEKLTCDEFIAQCPANKRLLYTRAKDEFETRGWGSRDATIKPFVKFEKLNFTKKTDPAPRVIQPRTPVYNIALGRFTRRVESELYHALAQEWDGDDEGVVMKGRTVEQVAAVIRAKWDRVPDPIAIGIDASRFDQHVSVGALKWEHSIYKTLFGNDPELCALLTAQLGNKGRAFIDGKKVSYKSVGTRASGDMNTSLGNCVIMCTLVREYIRELGIKAEFVNNGDDCVLIISRKDKEKLGNLNAWFLKYGFEMEVEKAVDVFEEIVFCQTQPVWSGTAWVMVRQPSVAFGKDAMALGESTTRGFQQWSEQVGVGGHALYGDIPIFGAYYDAYRRDGIASNLASKYLISDSGFMRMAKIPRVRGEGVCVPTVATRVSFYRAFGYPPSMQIAMERELKGYRVAAVQYSHINPSVACGLTTI